MGFMKKIFTANLILWSVLSSACAPQPASLPTPTSTVVVLPTNAAFSPTDLHDLVTDLVPQGPPLSEWNGIPIMPNAIAGEADTQGYRFTTAASREEILSFYQREIPDLGWEMLGVGEGQAGAVIMIFSAGEDSLSISIIPNDDTMLVLINK